MSRSSSQRKSRRNQLQASHQRRWLTGRYAVLEVLRAGRWPVDELYLDADLADAERQEVQQLVTSSGSIQFVDRERLTQLSGSSHHQGYVASMADYPYLQLADLLPLKSSESANVGYPGLLVICDRIQDTFNFGAILRCCDAMGVQGVLIGDAQQAAVTPQVARSSSGAVNHVPIAVTSDLLSAVADIRQAGFQIVAASEKSAVPAWDSVLSGPVALIIGSEAHGIQEAILAVCDQHLRVPMLGQVSSLNAAVAAGILLYEIRRQQQSV